MMANIELTECRSSDDIELKINAANDGISWQPSDNHRDDQVVSLGRLTSSDQVDVTPVPTV